MYVKNMQGLSYGGQESKKQCTFYNSDTHMTLKLGQGHEPGMKW